MELDLNDDDRRQLVVTLARHLAGHLHDNSVDIFGPGDYVGPFIEKMNQRGQEYAEFTYYEDGPRTRSCATSASRSNRSWATRRKTAG